MNPYRHVSHGAALCGAPMFPAAIAIGVGKRSFFFRVYGEVVRRI